MAPESEHKSSADRRGELSAWMAVIRSPALVWNALTLSGLTLALFVVLSWANGQVFLASGQIMAESRVVRVQFERQDEGATATERQAARLKSPRVYVADTAALEEISASLENLPRSLADAAELAQVDPVIRSQFGLQTAEALQAVRAHAVEGQPTPEWQRWVEQLSVAMKRTALVDEQTFQRQSQAVSERVQLRFGGEAPIEARTANVINAESPAVDARLRSMVDAAGFPGSLAGVVAARLKHRLKPTYKLDASGTDELAQLAAAEVKPRFTVFMPGQVIVTAGERLSAEKLDLVMDEAAEYRSQYDAVALGARRVAVLGVSLLAALGLGAYAATFATWLWGAPVRMAALAGLVALALGSSVWIASESPRLAILAITAPTLLVTVILAVAYDRRTALAIGSLLGILACVALDRPPGAIGIALCGVWVAVWRLREFRQRGALIRAGLITGLAVALASLLLAGLLRPMVFPGGIDEALWDCASAGIGSILVGFVALGLLPMIERVFDVTTGMSLIELRDPRHPLLRLLQQRAPGTYNHSLTVAGLAEAAAEAIRADSLLTYVGALYHDVGKSTKPEYFVENQSGTTSRHDRLTPAISHLVIVGHVQEGMELAREYDLPRSLHHFIESHHGTTLVEYFYHRARKQAEASAAAGGSASSGATQAPLEIEFRYPGPKPRTREAAVLMICDASESATRTLQDPSPARIDSLVRAIAHKRLMDGQFDDSELTMRDLARIVDAVSRGLSAIHHQRVVYPEGHVPAPAPASGPATGGPRTGEIGVESLAGPAEPARR
ncbi:MAG: HD family phosphohydrolase [Phycisphaerales bacterium]